MEIKGQKYFKILDKNKIYYVFQKTTEKQIDLNINDKNFKLTKRIMIFDE